MNGKRLFQSAWKDVCVRLIVKWWSFLLIRLALSQHTIKVWGGSKLLTMCRTVSSIASFQRKYSLSSFFNIFIWLFLRMIKTHWDISNRFSYKVRLKSIFTQGKRKSTTTKTGLLFNAIGIEKRAKKRIRNNSKICKRAVLMLLSNFLLFSSSFHCHQSEFRKHFHFTCNTTQMWMKERATLSRLGLFRMEINLCVSSFHATTSAQRNSKRQV